MLLIACEDSEVAEDDEGVAPTAPPSLPSVATAAPTEVGDAAVDEPAGLTSEAQKGEAGARAVLLAWARALERKDFAKARSLFGEDAARVPDHAGRLARFDTITVAAPVGRMEGAAGSLYYTSPVTVTGTAGSGARLKLHGPVVLRRVNDVPGASPEQLRWHIESADLEPVS